MVSDSNSPRISTFIVGYARSLTKTSWRSQTLRIRDESELDCPGRPVFCYVGIFFLANRTVNRSFIRSRLSMFVPQGRRSARTRGPIDPEWRVALSTLRGLNDDN